MDIHRLLRRFLPRYEVGLGAVASVEFLSRLLSDLPWQRISDSIVLPVIVSLFGNIIIPSSVVSTILTWTLFLLTCYTFSQSIYPNQLQQITSRHGFRLIVAFSAFIVAVLIGHQYTLRTHQSIVEIWFFGFILILAIGSVLLGYLRYEQSEPLLDPDGDAMKLVLIVDQYRTDELRKEIAEDLSADRNPWLDLGNVLLWVLGVGLLYTLPVVFLGGMIAIIGSLFPLMELLVLGWVVDRSVTERFGYGVSRWLPANRLLNVEDRFYDTISEGWLGGMKGPVAVAIPLIGLMIISASYLFSIGVIWSGYSLLIENSGHFLSAFVDQWDQIVLRSWGILGLFVVYSLMGVYGVWFWYRMLRRFPAFLTAWEEVVQNEEVGWLSVITGRALSDYESECDSTEFVARPPDYMLLPTLLFVSPIAVYIMLSSGIADWLAFMTWGVLWPSLLIGTIKSIGWTTEIDPQPPLTDQRALPATLVIGAIPLLCYAVGGGLFVEALVLLLLLVIVVPWLFFGQDIQIWAQDRNNIGVIAYATYLISPGMPLILVGFAITRYSAAMLGVGSAITLGGSVVLVIHIRSNPST